MCEYDVLWSGIVRHALRNAVLLHAIRVFVSVFRQLVLSHFSWHYFQSGFDILHSYAQQNAL